MEGNQSTKSHFIVIMSFCNTIELIRIMNFKLVLIYVFSGDVSGGFRSDSCRDMVE